MPTEQVNAWASYDQTAKSARHFSNERRRASVVTTPSAALAAGFSTPTGASGGGGIRQRRSVAGAGAGAGANIGRGGGRHSVATVYELEQGTAGISGSDANGPGFFELWALKHGKSTTQVLETKELQETQMILSTQTKQKIQSTFSVFLQQEGNEDVVELEETEGEEENEKSSSSFSFISLLSSMNATMSWVQQWMHASNVPFIIEFFEWCLRGIGQVYFQNSPLSGLLIWIGLFVQSVPIAIHGGIAVICGNATALLLGFDSSLAASGLFGYNSFLVGLALATFDSGSGQDFRLATILATIVFSSFTSVLFTTLGKLLVPYKSPPFTFPFNLATLLFLLSTADMGRVDYAPVRSPALPDYMASHVDKVFESSSTDFDVKAFFLGSIRGVGQVYLANNWVAGVLILAGIAVCSRISAIAAFLGSALGAATALATGVNPDAVANGMYGFNPSLTVTAMFMFYSPTNGAGILAVLAGIMTVFGQQGLATLLEPLGLPFMTLPFCAIALPFIIIQGTTSLVIAVPLATMTVPEDHRRRVNMLSDGFAFLKEALVPETAPRSSKMHSRKITNSLDQLGNALEEMEASDYLTTTTGDNNSNNNSNSNNNNNNKKSNNNARKDGTSSSGCFGSKKDTERDQRIKSNAMDIFFALDTQKTGHVSFAQITNALQATAASMMTARNNNNNNNNKKDQRRSIGDSAHSHASLHSIGANANNTNTNGMDMEALNFGTMILHLMDLDNSLSIDLREFVAFALVSNAIQVIRTKLFQFMDFVDTDASGDIDMEEIDAALEYLGQPKLREDEQENLVLLMEKYSNNDATTRTSTAKFIDVVDHDDGINKFELINAVTISKVKVFVRAFHGNTNGGATIKSGSSIIADA